MLKLEEWRLIKIDPGVYSEEMKIKVGTQDDILDVNKLVT